MTSYSIIRWRSICHQSIKTCSVYLDSDTYGRPKTVPCLYNFRRGFTKKRTSDERKTSDARHIRRKSVRHRDNTWCVSHRRFQLLSSFHHVGYCIVKVKSKRCSSILWQNERAGSSLVSLLLTIFCLQENPFNVITLETIFRSTAKSSNRNSIGHIMTTECIILKCLNMNSALHPNISLYVRTRRICLIIKSFPDWWSLLVFLWP